MTVATEYFSKVLSPWVPGVHNPLPLALEALSGPQELAVDVGCGPGILLCHLAQRFERVIGVDRNPAMVEAAGELVEKLRAQGAELGEVELRCDDWIDCHDIGKANLVCAVNSILEPEPSRRREMLQRLRTTLNAHRDSNPTLLAIFPAMEAQIHLLRLYAAKLRQAGLTKLEVRRSIDEEFLTAHQFDALAGTFSSRSSLPQKFYYQWELGWELADAAFDVCQTGPVVYPWEVCREVDAGYFPDEVELFDWFVEARPA